MVGTDKVVQSMVLVGPDTQYNLHVPIIVGTNTFRLLAKHCAQAEGKHFLASLPVRCEVAHAYTDLGAGSVEGRLGPVRLRNRNVVVPAGECVRVKGLCKVVVPHTRSAVLVQESVHGDLAPCVRVVACKVPADRLCHLHVWLHNASDTDIEVRKRQVIADVFTMREEYAVDRVMSHLQVSQSGKTNSTSPSRAPQEEHPLEFQFGEGTPAEWRAQFGGRLQAYQDGLVYWGLTPQQQPGSYQGGEMMMKSVFWWRKPEYPEETNDLRQVTDDVFTRHEFELGKTDAVKFDIDLEPGPPIRERP